MASSALMKLLVVEYAFIAGFCFWEGEIAKGLYWVGAILVTLAVLWM